uniref:Uncharacterized protein n=1 Tax=Rhizophora mucronata TaxID=61149 RepID=A0A2P2Q239_RHIMU
MFWWVFRVYLN